MKNYRKKRWKLLTTVILIYLVVGIVLYFIQDRIIFHPKALPKEYVFKFDQPFKEINLKTEENHNLNIVQFFTKEKPKGLVLFFHGNMTNIERYAPLAPYFTKHNLEVWMIDYPGYGKSTGKRTEQRMYSDALQFFEIAKQKFSPENIIIYGKSLGTGIASYLASEKNCKKAILETPYYSMRSMARTYAPLYPAALIKYSFPVNKYLKKVTVPITVFHGTTDEVIPYKQSKKLKEELPKIELITVPGALHNNLYKFPLVTQKLDSLLAG
jgi:uncharacterized protein